MLAICALVNAVRARPRNQVGYRFPVLVCFPRSRGGARAGFVGRPLARAMMPPGILCTGTAHEYSRVHRPVAKLPIPTPSKPRRVEAAAPPRRRPRGRGSPAGGRSPSTQGPRRRRSSSGIRRRRRGGVSSAEARTPSSSGGGARGGTGQGSETEPAPHSWRSRSSYRQG